MKAELNYKEYQAYARQMSAEGCVLLENRAHTLPIRQGERVSIFGRIQIETYYCGTGSGGLVNPPYVVSIQEGIRQQCAINEDLAEIYRNWLEAHPFDMGKGWAQEPWSQEEMPVSRELAQEAARNSDLAVVVIGRTAGEDQDSKAEPGAYYLSRREEEMMENVCAAFDRVAIVLNVGSILDMSWVKKYRPGAVLYSWQGGCEGGNGLADVLTGAVNPSGCLPDTIAWEISDYPAGKNFGDPDENCYMEDIYIGYRYFETFAPERVQYPFGYGLSYTTFCCETVDCTVKNDVLESKIRVKNTGDRAGKRTVQLYVCPPQGLLGKPTRNLIGFAKTGLLEPGHTEHLTIRVPVTEFASYDDSGVSGYPYSWVLESGEYEFYVGFDVRNAGKVSSWALETTRVTEKLRQAMAPLHPFGRIRTGVRQADWSYTETVEQVPLRQYDLQTRIEQPLPEQPYVYHESPVLWQDVCAGKKSIDTFLEQFTDEELACLTRGEGMCSPKVTPGTAATYGGVTQRLQQCGMPACCCADGPSGIRMDCGAMAFSLPNGTAIASAFNVELTEILFSYLGRELVKNQVDTLLGPGLNIHRYPLCGRNFEYFSEDPLLTGTMAVAQLAGMHPYGVTGTIKHFACNNQEFKRHTANAVVSERALREIYLKAFEIAVKKGQARSIMTSYNPVNGIWAASNYDLLTTILREEWGFDGMVMTDWWAQMNDENEAPSQKNTAAMIRAQNDVYMVVADSASNSSGDNTNESLSAKRISRAHILRCAKNMCRVAMQTNASYGHKAAAELVILNEPEFRNTIQTDTVCELGQDCVELSIPASTNRGTRLDYTIHAPQGVRYGFGYRIHTQQVSELAQVPFSIFVDQKLVKTITLKGTAECEETVVLGSGDRHTIQLFFGDNGLFVDRLYLYRL